MIRAGVVAGALLCCAMLGAGVAQQAIPIHTLVRQASTDSGAIDKVDAIHVQSDGRVLVNDGVRHRLLLFDSTLRKFKVVADTAGESPTNYGVENRGQMGNIGLLPFPGDSVAFVDNQSRALIVIDAQGRFGRVTTPPTVGDMGYFIGGVYGTPGFDERGHLYYRSTFDFQLPKTTAGQQAAETTYVTIDSAPVLRADLDARRVDTIAMMRTPKRRNKIIINTTGGATLYQVVNPMPYTDEWAYFPDGTVAIVRGQDYHIDWILPNGTHESSEKMPFDWRRVTDAEKQSTVESAQRLVDSVRDGNIARMVKANAASTTASISKTYPRTEVLTPKELPDYYPPIRVGGQVRVDGDGNLWILPTTSLQAKGGLLYDVVNRKGVIIERIQFPEGRALAGFGPSGIVFMLVPSGYSWARLERAQIKR